MNSIIKYQSDKKRIILFLSFFLIVFISGASNPNKDSLKSKYEINDPRNPNCPCHKYQKIADEEYEKWLKKQSKEQGIAISKLDTRDDAIKRRNHYYFIKNKSKRKNKMHPKLKRLFDFTRYNILKKVWETDACFKWKK